MTPAALTTPGTVLPVSPLEAVAREYVEVTGQRGDFYFKPNYHDRAEIWREHCERERRAADRSWYKALIIVGLVASFFAGFMAAAIWFVQ